MVCDGCVWSCMGLYGHGWMVGVGSGSCRWVDHAFVMGCLYVPVAPRQGVWDYEVSSHIALMGCGPLGSASLPLSRECEAHGSQECQTETC